MNNEGVFLLYKFRIMELLILGSGSAVPKIGRNPSGQLLMFPNAHYLIDCAEGTQMRLLEERIRPKYLKAIFISHLHGDHYLGLMGLLWSLDLGGRTAPLTLVSPKGLSAILKMHLKHANSRLNYELDHVEVEVNQKGMIFKDKHISVTCFPLKHGVPCNGFRFNERPLRRRFRKDVVSELQLDPDQIRAALAHRPVYDSAGDLVPLESLFLPEVEPRSYTYCTDTLVAKFALEEVMGSTVLYHEATYDHSLLEKAESRFHTTAKQAAELAKESNVHQLIIGHYSSRYDDPELLRDEARQIFPHTVAAEDGLRIVIQTPVPQNDSI